MSCYCVTFLSLLKLGPLLLQISFTETAAPYLRTGNVPQPCPRNKYVETYADGTKRCSRCSECARGFQVQEKCSAFNNTLCEPCPSGFYNDKSGSRCKPCSGCMLGEYIRRSCTAKRDTKCHKCPRDTYSLSANATACLICKRCRRNEKTISKCNRIRDTVCGDCFHDYFRESSTGSCLRCSPCPHELQHLVVSECREKFGIHHPNICWPGEHGETRLRINTVDENYSYIPDITDKILDVELEDFTYMRKIVTYIPVILGFIVSCAVVSVSVFIIMNFIKCEQCRNTTRLVDFGNDRNFDVASIRSRGSRDDAYTQKEYSASVGTGSVNSNEHFYSELEVDDVSANSNEGIPVILKDMSREIDSINSIRNS